MKNSILYLFMTALPVLGLVTSCSQLREEYTISIKQPIIMESTSFVEGFVQNNHEIFQGNGEVPADRLVIPIKNGFGRTFEFRFTDESATTGVKVENATYTLENRGDQQMLYFNLSGIPKLPVPEGTADPASLEGVIPVSYEIFEDGVSLFSTLKANIAVAAENADRPETEFIPTVERPFVFVKADITWVNQDVVSWYNMAVPPTAASFTVSGVNYTMLLNLRYNSVLSSTKALMPDYTTVEVENSAGVMTSQQVVTALYPTQENLEAHPEWFQLENGELSAEWTAGSQFKHGVGAKPINIGYYNPNAAPVTLGSNSSVPISSLSWNINPRNANHPLGTFIENAGTYKLWIKFNNNDEALDVIQYLPTHPGTGEPGWVPLEFTVESNPNPPFSYNPETDNPDWMPTEEQPVKAVRGEILQVNAKDPFVFTPGVPVPQSGTSGYIRIFFISLKDYDGGANFKSKQKDGYSLGFEDAEIERMFGAGSRLGTGVNNNYYNRNVHTFADPQLSELYNVSYVDLNLNKTSILMQAEPGEYKVWGVLDGTAGNKPNIGYEMPYPVIVRIAE